MKQTLMVRAIIKQDNKVLLLRRSTGNPIYTNLYELPGGKVEFGEDPRATLQREILNDTSREVETQQLQDVFSELDARDEQHQYIELVFLVALKPETTIQVDETHDKYTWKKLSEIQLKEVTETTRLALQMEPEMINQSVGSISNDVPGTTSYELIMYADGGSRGNPGPSASGFVIMNAQEQIIFRGGEYIGITTNNQAEYQAVKFGLEKALSMGAKHIKVRLDSLLVVNQLKGVYKVKNTDLLSVHAYIKNLLTQFESVSISHVRREFNKDADAMVNKILDEHEA